MTPSEAIGRADEAKAELRLTGEAFQAIRNDCREKIIEVSRMVPVDPAALQALALKIRIADEVQDALGVFVADGTAAEAELTRLRKIESMNPTQRRYADALGKP